MNENADVTQIMFEFYYSLPLKRHVDRLPDNDQSYIWVDKCNIQMSNSNTEYMMDIVLSLEIKE